MSLVVSVHFKIDTKSTQTPKNRHKMQKIDTKNIPLIVRATVNDKRKIRVYVNMERVKEFDTIQEAIKFMRHKTPLELLFDKIWDTPKDKFAWRAIFRDHEEMEKDRIESEIIKQCAEKATSEAHNKEVHRQQIMQAFITGFQNWDSDLTPFEYYNQTYGHEK